MASSPKKLPSPQSDDDTVNVIAYLKQFCADRKKIRSRRRPL
jgi:hypothetical protein